MLWCLIIPALLSLVLAVLTLTFTPPRPPRVRPGRLLRGCLAVLFLGLALALGTIALAVSSGWVTSL